MGAKQNNFWKKILLALLPFGLASYVLLNDNIPDNKLDSSILILVVLSLLIVILPWEEGISSFKAAGLEVSMNKPQIDKALEDLNVLKFEPNPLRLFKEWIHRE